MADHATNPISYSHEVTQEDTGKASLDVVILVHGTFAYADNGSGPRWWQRGSVFWKRLKTELPSNIGMLDSQPLFKWSGENHYMSRYTAGIDLLTYIKEFEKWKTPYHIVAHSHGGTVLWNALRIAYLSANRQRRRKPTSTCPFDLPYLRSCTAVATPFIRFKTLSNPMLRLWVAEAVSLTITFGLPTAAVLVLWPIAGLWALIALLSVLVFAPFGERSAFSTKFAAMQYIDAAIARSLGDRWLSLWSENDEAINLLRAANDVHIPVFKPPLPLVPYAHQNLLTKVFFFEHTLFIFRNYSRA
jgi:hypothetical protein